MACASCGDTTHPSRWSDAAQADVCFHCYSRLPASRYVEPTEPVVRLPSPPPYVPSPSHRLIARWQRFLGSTGMPFFNVAEGAHTTYSARCPVCEHGFVVVDFPKGIDPPVARLNDCTAGCAWEDIVRGERDARRH